MGKKKEKEKEKRMSKKLNTVTVEMLRGKNPDDWVTAADAREFAAKLRRLGFSLDRIVANTHPASPMQETEVTLDEMREAGITEAVDLFVFFGAYNTKGDVGQNNVAQLMRQLEANDGPGIEQYAVVWAILNPAPHGVVRTKAESYAAVLGIPIIGVIVNNALKALYSGYPKAGEKMAAGG